MEYIKDVSRFSTLFAKFEAYVRYHDKKLGRKDAGKISFTDISGILARQEDYKSTAALKAQKALEIEKWKPSWIGNREIAPRVVAAIKCASQYIINWHQQSIYEALLTSAAGKNLEKAELALYDIYCGADEEKAFAETKEVFGARYDILAFLFFVKDRARFLPCSANNFDDGFAALGIEYTMSNRCGWKNYIGFIDVIREVRGLLETVLADNNTEVRLIDAHSFVWIIREKAFREWEPDADEAAWIEEEAEAVLSTLAGDEPEVRERSSRVYVRSAEIAVKTKERAKGICELCKKPAPFRDKKGLPYLESHHIIWLSKGGTDTLDNTAALCPNCHTRMHVVDDERDIKTLLRNAMKASP